MSEAVVWIADRCGAPRARRQCHRPITRGANAASVRGGQADQWYGIGLLVAAWSGRWLTPPALPSFYVVGGCVASLPAASVPCIRVCSKPAGRGGAELG